MTSLPIDEVLPDISAALETSTRLVLAAPPGAGKTTRVPLALLNAPWCKGQIILLEPRRIAARRAALRLAEQRGEPLGEGVGLLTRYDHQISTKTRICVVTEGVFTRMAVSDPGLEGVSAVLFDEFHERSLDADLGLALGREIQSALRDDLRLVIMSATLDTAAIAARFDAPVIESEGRSYPVETIHVGRPGDRLEPYLADIIRRALREQEGSILAFLPGAGEIRRTAAYLEDIEDDVIVAPLYGALSPKDQDAAIAPAPDGRRKVVLATDIAESSLTIEGVTVVVDAGLARVPRYRPDTGVQTLETVRASRANVDQRRGRAGRTAPGVCYRLWDGPEDRGLTPSPVPEILASDLSGLVLSVREWGEPDPRALPFLEPPPDGPLDAAMDMLERLRAFDEGGRLSPVGRKMAQLPLPPRLAHMVATAETDGEKILAAELAAMLSERGIGGTSTDLARRLSAFRRDGSGRAKALKAQAKRWSGKAPGGDLSGVGPGLARSFPDRIARRVEGEDGRFRMAGGGSARGPREGKIGSDWIVIAELTGRPGSLTITGYGELTQAEALAVIPARERVLASFDPKSGKVRARRVKGVGEIILSETPLPKPDRATEANALTEYVTREGLDALDVLKARKAVQARADRLAGGWDAIKDEHLSQDLGWLAYLVETHGIAGLTPGRIKAYLMDSLDWSDRERLRQAFPDHWQSPMGRQVPIDYEGERAPLVQVRVQEVFGLTRHPMLAEGRIPLTLELLSPAGRVVAVTKDLPGFWSGGYSDMRKDMKGRYPKHPWPENPASADATLRAKPRGT